MARGVAPRALPSLDDCSYGLRPAPDLIRDPTLTRSSRHRCLERHGIGRLPEIEGDAPKRKRFAASRPPRPSIRPGRKSPKAPGLTHHHIPEPYIYVGRADRITSVVLIGRARLRAPFRLCDRSRCSAPGTVTFRGSSISHGPASNSSSSGVVPSARATRLRHRVLETP